MYRSQSRITASNPSRLIKRLCNHWRHKFPVQLDEQGGDIELPLGRCSLRANEGVLDAKLSPTIGHSCSSCRKWSPITWRAWPATSRLASPGRPKPVPSQPHSRPKTARWIPEAAMAPFRGYSTG